MADFWVSLVLLLLNVVQAAFWMRQTQKLVDKLMSRNYAEYSQSVSQSNLTKATSKSDPPSDELDQDFRTLEGIGI